PRTRGVPGRKGRRAPLAAPENPSRAPGLASEGPSISSFWGPGLVLRDWDSGPFFVGIERAERALAERWKARAGSLSSPDGNLASREPGLEPGRAVRRRDCRGGAGEDAGGTNLRRRPPGPVALRPPAARRRRPDALLASRETRDPALLGRDGHGDRVAPRRRPRARGRH